MARLLRFAPLLLLIADAPDGVPPKPAPPVFATPERGLTFATPAGSTYCPLPDDFVGSDHGTLIFLAPPERCSNDAGYPSVARGFLPAATPRIEVFYAYRLDDSEVGPAKKCRSAGTIQLFGAAQPLCLDHGGRTPSYSVQGIYQADSGMMLILTLVTSRARAAQDLKALEALAASARACSSIWHSEDVNGKRDGPDGHLGTGPLCPEDSQYF
jgi:hypothetical protein